MRIVRQKNFLKRLAHPVETGCDLCRAARWQAVLDFLSHTAFLASFTYCICGDAECSAEHISHVALAGKLFLHLS